MNPSFISISSPGIRLILHNTRDKNIDNRDYCEIDLFKLFLFESCGRNQLHTAYNGDEAMWMGYALVLSVFRSLKAWRFPDGD